MILGRLSFCYDAPYAQTSETAPVVLVISSPSLGAPSGARLGVCALSVATMPSKN